MKINKINILNSLLICALMFLCTSTFLPKTANAALLYESITANDLYEKITEEESGYTVVDTRPITEYEIAHIPGAVSIPLREFGYRLYELDKTQDIIVYCELGLQSKVASQILANAGFKDVYNLTGGFIAWTFPVETTSGRVVI